MTIISINDDVVNELNELSKLFVHSVSFVIFKKWFIADNSSIKKINLRIVPYGPIHCN